MLHSFFRPGDLKDHQTENVWQTNGKTLKLDNPQGFTGFR
jgi:hypothetical protein